MTNHIDIQRAHDANINTPRLKETLAQDRKEYDDCTPCRVIGGLEKSVSLLSEFSGSKLTCTATGATAFIGLGGYTYFSGHNQLRQRQAQILKSGSRLGLKARGVGITIMSIGLGAIGLYRLVN
jgi:hypothetical protein